MKRVKIQQTIKYEIDVPDDWNRQISEIVNTKDKEFLKQYDKIFDIEEAYDSTYIANKYDKCSVPDNLKIIHTTILDKQK